MTARPACPRSENIPGGALWRAPAKLNLTLRVSARRPDGFHDLDSAVAKVTLYDELIFRPRTDGEVALGCAGFDCGPVERNLVYRAAMLLKEFAAAGSGANISLAKSIPPGAGLGGGSSDAATALMALNELWSLALPPARLAELAASLGSDVPLFLAGPSVRIRGRGEIVEPLAAPPFQAILCLSGLHCSTADVYKTFDAMGGGASSNMPSSPGEGTRAYRAAIPDLSRPSQEWRIESSNDLRPAAEKVCPELVDLAQRLSAATGLPACLTGSGSALFVICGDDEPQAPVTLTQAQAALPDCRCELVSLNPW